MAKKPARIDRRISVILLESNKHLGEKYEVVKVKPIFAKNVLFAQDLAVLADANNLHGYKAKMEAAQKTKVKKTDEYKHLFDKISADNGLAFSMKANEKGVLYEKIDPTHIINHIHDLYKVSIESHLFKMKKKITQIGEYTVPFQYHDLEKDLHIIVKAESAKAEKEVQPEEQPIE